MGLTVCTSRPNIIQNGHRRKNTCFCCMRTTQAQTSLHIHTVCSATYIFAIGIFGNLKEPSTPATRNASRLELVSIAEQFINLCLASLRQYTLSGLIRPAGETPPSLAGRWWPTFGCLLCPFCRCCTDQPAHLYSLISNFVIHLLESIISKLATSEISFFGVVSVAEQAGLGMTILETPKTGFLAPSWMGYVMANLQLLPHFVCNFARYL